MTFYYLYPKFAILFIGSENTKIQFCRLDRVKNSFLNGFLGNWKQQQRKAIIKQVFLVKAFNDILACDFHCTSVDINKTGGKKKPITKNIEGSVNQHFKKSSLKSIKTNRLGLQLLKVVEHF